MALPSTFANRVLHVLGKIADRYLTHSLTPVTHYSHVPRGLQDRGQLSRSVYRFLELLYNIVRGLYMTIKSSELRRNLFSVLDRCLETGEELTVPRKSGTLRIAPVKRRLRVAELPERPGVLVDGDNLDRFSPSEWSPDALS